VAGSFGPRLFGITAYQREARAARHRRHLLRRRGRRGEFPRSSCWVPRPLADVLGDEQHAPFESSGGPKPRGYIVFLSLGVAGGLRGPLGRPCGFDAGPVDLDTPTCFPLLSLSPVAHTNRPQPCSGRRFIGVCLRFGCLTRVPLSADQLIV